MRTPNLNRLLCILSGLLFLSWVSTAKASDVCHKIFERLPEKAEVRTYLASDTVSQYVRDNAPDFWAWAKKNGEEYFEEIQRHEGVVIGDSHPGNFIYSLLGGKMKFFIMDIKDAGQGSYIVDIAHQIMATNAVLRVGDANLEKATTKQLDAYLRGLKNKDFKIDKDIEWIFETSKEDFEADMQKYITDKTKGNRFKDKEDMIEPLEKFVPNAKERKALQDGMTVAVKKSIKGGKILDFAYRPRERGGSKNLKRYWALVEAKGERMILEFKQIEAPAVAQFSKQLPALKRFEHVMKTLWEVDDPLYKAVEINGEPYWMRPKKIDVFNIPYKQKNEYERKQLMHIAEYQAYLMGRYHGKQEKKNTFTEEVEKYFDELSESINIMANDYLGRLEAKVEKLKENEDYD